MVTDGLGNVVYSVESEVLDIIEHARKTVKSCSKIINNDLLKERCGVDSFDLNRVGSMIRGLIKTSATPAEMSCV